MNDSSKESLGPPPGLSEKVGRYKIVEPIGMGGMASVFRATDPDGQVVAVKILHPQSVLPEDVRRFTREFKALSRMDHPNIVKVYEAGVADGFPWIAMEYVDGEDLEKALVAWAGDDHPDRWGRVDQVLRGLCDGLQYVHDLGLVHRDLKPTNVLMTGDGHPKISDFGVVKDPSATGTQLTKAGRLVGTVAFMAPEQITGDVVDQRADLYSLGAVLYVMLTGRRPIEAESVAGYLARHLTEVPVAPGQIDGGVPPRLEQVCLRLLAKDPDRRYATARAVVQALDRPATEVRVPLRGRDDLLAWWGRKLAALDAGAGGVIALTGRPGSGRTFILEAMASEASAHGVRVGHVRAGDGALVTGLLRQLRDGGVDALETGPVAVLVDDLDRFPAEDVDALAYLARDQIAVQGRPLLVVYAAASSTGHLTGIASGTSTGIPVETQPLAPLDRAAIVTMMRDRGIMGPAAPVLGRRLFEDYAGLPGAALQQLGALFDAGWLEHVGDEVRVHKPVKELRRATLPVPEVVRKRLTAELEALDPLGQELLQVLALLGRPASASLLERCTSDPEWAARTLDALVDAALLRRTTEETSETVDFAHPCAAAVIRDTVHPADKPKRHAAIARALSSRRRRDAAREVAVHLMHAGELVPAYPMFVRAARRAARAGLFLDVLEVCRTAEMVRQEAEPGLPEHDVARYRRWIYLLEGEAQLARGRWDDATGPLELAVSAARTEGDPAMLARCLGSLGRAHYRRGRFEVAEPLLEEALECADEGAPERASATRALADIRLRDGKIDEARDLWKESLEISTEIGSRDGEARARRGLAHVAALQGKLAHAAELLDAAEDLLKLGGDDRVRAGVMARSIELDNAAGRFASALHRADVLLDLVRNGDMPERMPEAFALQAEALVMLGDHDAATRAAREALTFARAQASPSWPARLRIARVLCDVGILEDAQRAMPDAEHIPASRIEDPSAQLAALRARLMAAERPMDAVDLGAWALVRPPPLLCLRAARIGLDVSTALRQAGDVDQARSAAKKGLRALQGPGSDGFRLELLLALNAAAPDERVLAAGGLIASRIADSLPAGLAESFRNRPQVAEALKRAP